LRSAAASQHVGAQLLSAECTKTECKSIQVEFLNTYTFTAQKVAIFAEKKQQICVSNVKGQIYGKH